MKILMRLGRRKSNGIYFIETEGGKRTSLGTRNKALARQLYRKAERKYLKGKVAHLVGECTTSLKAFRKEYVALCEGVLKKSTYRANLLALDKLIDAAGDSTRLDRVSSKHIAQIVADHRRRGIKKTSINNYIRHAKAVLSLAVEWRLVSKNPLAGVKQLDEGKRIPKAIHKDDLPRLLSKIKDIDVRRLVTTYIATGRRRGEICSLRHRDIDLARGRYTPPRSKSKWIRTYRINNMFAAVLTAIGRGEPDELIFPRWTRPDSHSHIVKKALVDAGLGHHSLHSLRHTFASMMAAEGRTLKEVQDLLGQVDIKATQIYTHLFDDHMDDIGEVNIGPVDLVGEG